MLKTFSEDLKFLFHKLGVVSNDIVMVHSSLFSLGLIQNGVEGFHDVLSKSIGPEGCIIVPTFTHSYRHNKIYNLKQTPSDKTLGLYSEYIRNHKNAIRNSDPLFSMAALGNNDNLIERNSINCFGVGSVYEKLFNADVLFIALGISYSTGLSAFMHLEKLAEVPYRKDLKLYGESIDENNTIYKDSAIHFARNEEDFYLNGRTNREPIGKDLERVGISKAVNFRNGKHFSIRAKSFKEFVLERLEKDKMCMFENNKI